METDRKRRYGEPTISLHREIKKAVDTLAKKNDASCVLVSAIEKKVGRDPRTVRFHLKLLEEGEYGRLTKDGKLFCSKRPESK